MILKTGDQAPDFSLADYTGKMINLSDYANDRVMICFFRYAGCPFCNLSLLKIIQYYPRFEKHGLKIIAFFQSPADSVKEIPAGLNPPFPLIPDPSKSVYDKYGVQSSLLKSAATLFELPKVWGEFKKNNITQKKMDGDPFLIPAFFLIGPHGTVVHSSYYGENMADMIPFIKIEDFLLFGNK